MSLPRYFSRSLTAAAAGALLFATVLALAPARSNAETDRRASPRSVAPVPRTDAGTAVSLVGSAVVNIAELAQMEARGLAPVVAPRVLIHESGMEENEMDFEPGADVVGAAAPQMMFSPPPFVPFVASPSPANSFQGLDDIAMVDSSFIIIPPDVSGAVGPSKVMCGFNNNYRVQDKSTGATLLTVGTATFWNPVITDKTLLTQLTDPRTVYDPIQNRWIVAMQTVNTNGLILFGVSQTSDPAGSWFLYAVQLSPLTYLMDFPTLGFNKNWICVSINRYTSPGGAFSRGVQIVANYALARAGTLLSVTQFDPGAGAGTRFVASPCVTLSATEDTLFLPTHLGSGTATYQVDVITGTPALPVYTSGGAQTRPGGAWTQPSGNQLPQSAPNAGASACGATPCPIESQDSQIRSAPTYRLDSTTGRGFIYYTQTIRLTAPVARNLVQWTKITPGGGGTTPVFADGGRIDDATGANLYAYPHIAVNSVGDFIVGYSRFGSALHPSAGYSVHIASEGLGTIRDALIYKPGDDYYHKTFSTTTGRNRWGDFSTAQVDPNDDRSLWTLQEYAKTRTGTDDGNTGSNSSKWSSYWAVVGGPAPTVTIAAGPSLNEGNSGTTSFDFTVNLSGAYSVPVTVNYQTSDGTATVADNDYQAASSSIVIPSGSTSGTITVLVNGDTKCEADEAFTVSLTSATNGTIGAPSVSTGTILNEEVPTITATAGAGGSISPSGASTFACGANQTYNISPSDKCHAILDVKVDGVSVGAVASHTFTNITANHTIDATFSALGPFKLSASAGAGGTISPSGSVVTACGGSQKFDIAPADKCHAILDVKVDGVSVGAVASYTLNDVQGNHSIEASFVDLGPFTVTSTAGPGGTITPSGATGVACGGTQGYTITPSSGFHIVDVKVDGLSVGAVASYTFNDVQANHTIDATFTENVAVLEASFHARTVDEGVELTWDFGGSVPPASVTLERSAERTGPWARVAAELRSEAGATVALDRSAAAGGTYYYRLSVTVSPGRVSVFGPLVGTAGAPIKELALTSVAPNPTSGSVRIEYAVPRDGPVELRVLDVEGRSVAVLTSGTQPRGRYQVTWRGQTARGPARAGMYFIQIQSAGKSVVRRLALVR